MLKDVEHEIPPERHFGLLFFVILTAIGAYGLWAGWAIAYWLTLFCVGTSFLLAALITPKMLKPLNVAWYHFGLLLARIINPIVLGILFFGLLTPVALFGRLARRDELRLKQRGQSTYWIDRDPPGPAADSFHNQF